MKSLFNICGDKEMSVEELISGKKKAVGESLSKRELKSVNIWRRFLMVSEPDSLDCPKPDSLNSPSSSSRLLSDIHSQIDSIFYQETLQTTPILLSLNSWLRKSKNRRDVYRTDLKHI
jgi:hypothetical protein